MRRISSAELDQDDASRLAGFRPTDIDALAADGGIVVLAAHPDDEVLGCGGLIAEASARGIDIHVLILTDGGASHAGVARDALVAMRREESLAGLSLLGAAASRATFLGYPDGALATEGFGFDLAVEAVAASLRQLRAGCVIAPWRGDPHPDHMAAAHIAQAASAAAGVSRRLAYAVWAWARPAVEPLPESGIALDVRRHVARRRAALRAHQSQLGTDPTMAREFCLPPAIVALVERPFEYFFEAA
jgi:LmbE family N-acetylglucosaminyl deacetylase